MDAHAYERKISRLVQYIDSCKYSIEIIIALLKEFLKQCMSAKSPWNV